MRKITMNVFLINFFVIFVFFPVHSFASAKIYKLFGLIKKGQVTKTEAEHIHSLLENHPDLARLIGNGDPHVTTTTIRGFLDNESSFQDYLGWVITYKGAREASYIFSALWYFRNLKSEIFYYVNKEHLIDNDEFFLKWLKVAQWKRLTDIRLRRFIDDSIDNIKKGSGGRTLSGIQIQDGLLRDSFMQTLIRLSREANYLNDFIEEIMEEILNNPEKSLTHYTQGLA